MTQHIEIYTDGAARGNPGRGGYGAILMFGDKRKEISKGYKHTTNNRMELMAVIAAFDILKRDGLSVKVYTDSQYIVRAIKEGWLKKWLATNFAKGIKNKDLWLRLHALLSKHKVEFFWVKGHASNPYNNRCDELATTAADGGGLEIDAVFESGLTG